MQWSLREWLPPYYFSLTQKERQFRLTQDIQYRSDRLDYWIGKGGVCETPRRFW